MKTLHEGTESFVEPKSGQEALVSYTVERDSGRGGPMDYWEPESEKVLFWDVTKYYDEDGNEIDESDVCKELLALIEEEMSE